MKKTVLKFTMFCAIVSCTAGIGNAKTWESLRNDIENKYKGFHDDIRSMVIRETKNVNMESMGGMGGNMESSSVMYLKGKKSRIETEMMGRKTVMVFDPSRRESDEGGMGQASMNWWDTLEKYKGRIEGVEKVSGRECYRVAFAPDNDEKFFDTAWIDKDSLMLIKGRGAEQGKEFSIVNSDIRKIKGKWQWPYSRKVYMDGKLVSEDTVTSIEVNVKLADSLFEEQDTQSGGNGTSYSTEMDYQKMGQQMKNMGIDRKLDPEKMKKLRQYMNSDE